MFTDEGGWLWLVIDVVLVAVLAGVLGPPAVPALLDVVVVLGPAEAVAAGRGVHHPAGHDAAGDTLVLGHELDLADVLVGQDRDVVVGRDAVRGLVGPDHDRGVDRADRGVVQVLDELAACWMPRAFSSSSGTG